MLVGVHTCQCGHMIEILEVKRLSWIGGLARADEMESC